MRHQTANSQKDRIHGVLECDLFCDVRSWQIPALIIPAIKVRIPWQQTMSCWSRFVGRRIH